MPNPLHYQQTQGQLDASPRRCLITEPRHFNHDATLISPSLQEITLQPITLQDCLPQCPCKMMAREMILEQFLGFSTSPNQRLGLLSIRSRAFNQIIVCKFPSCWYFGGFIYRGKRLSLSGAACGVWCQVMLVLFCRRRLDTFVEIGVQCRRSLG